MAEMRSSKIVHKNYLEELRKSKVIKRNNKEWQNVLESKRHIDMRDRFDLIKSDFEKTDKRIQSLEFLKRQGAGKESNKPTLKRDRSGFKQDRRHLSRLNQSQVGPAE